MMRFVDVMPTLGRHMLLDGYDFVLDLDASRGPHLVDAITRECYLDFFSFFGSAPLGMNHPALRDDPGFLDRLCRSAVNKPSNSDMYTTQYAEFVAAFYDLLGDPELPHLFFIDGGALAVENALKAAFDWKDQRTDGQRAPLAAMHLAGAFHGRSGYTMSMTNTDPRKTDRFPIFDWPRISTPAVTFPQDLVDPTALQAAEREALAQAEAAFADPRWRVACVVAEPIQGEGGDRHLRAEFLTALQRMCQREDALFVVDEVQTGGGVTGTPWAYQQLGLRPDLVAFGKRTQVCGVMAGRRIDEVPGNVFTTASRISSTWGGNLVDMVRATRTFRVIEQEGLIPAAVVRGQRLLAGLRQVAAEHSEMVSNVRGRGLMCAFDLPDAASRDRLVGDLYRQHRVLVLPTGQRGVRFRPPLSIGAPEIDHGVAAVAAALRTVPAGHLSPQVSRASPPDRRGTPPVPGLRSRRAARRW